MRKNIVAVRLIKDNDALFIATRDSTACYTFKQNSMYHDPAKALEKIAELLGLEVVITNTKPDRSCNGSS